MEPLRSNQQHLWCGENKAAYHGSNGASHLLGPRIYRGASLITELLHRSRSRPFSGSMRLATDHPPPPGSDGASPHSGPSHLARSLANSRRINWIPPAFCNS
jgi:hypothetical protein